MNEVPVPDSTIVKRTSKRRISFKNIINETPILLAVSTSAKNLRGSFENLITTKEVFTSISTSETNNSPSPVTDMDIPELEVFRDSNTRNGFEIYTREQLLQEQFLYYELYHVYLKEEKTEKKTLLEVELYDNFIDTRGKFTISLYHKIRTKVKKLYENKSSKAFYLVYKEVCFKTIFNKSSKRSTICWNQFQKLFSKVIYQKKSLKKKKLNK
jgi:hypothetical protein